MLHSAKLLPYISAFSVSSWMATKSLKYNQLHVEASAPSSASSINTTNSNNNDNIIKFDEIDFNGLYPNQDTKQMKPRNVTTESAHWVLSYNEIWRRLSRSANQVNVNRGRVSHYTINSYAANNPIEDSYSIRTKLNTNGLTGMLFGVFDGHSGTHCSHFCRDELFDFIEYTAATTQDSEIISSTINTTNSKNGNIGETGNNKNNGWFGGWSNNNKNVKNKNKTKNKNKKKQNFEEKFEKEINDREMCNLIEPTMINTTNNNNNNTEGGYTNINEYFEKWNLSHKMMPFIKSFLLADSTFLTSQQRLNINNGMTGACAVVCHINGDWITTAWVGDCRALVGQKVYDPIKKQYKWKCVPLTQDHQIDMHSGERNRLLKEHPNEDEVIKRDRVKGRLQPTRVFGDGHYKRMEYFNNWRNASKYSTWTPPYVIAKPEISCYELQDNDKFIIMACDGLFQDLQNDEIIDAIGELYDNNNNNTNNSNGNDLSINPSTQLIWNALLAASRALQGRMNTEEINLSSILQLPNDVKRRVHDDVTVIFIGLSDKSDTLLHNKSDQENCGRDVKVPPRLMNLLEQKIVSKI